MLLSLKHNFLFVHIAKTGGTSVREALQPLRWRDPWYLAQGICHRLSKLSKDRIGMKFPRHAKAILAKEALPEKFYDGLFKFTFVRNPWDLQVSSFHHIRRSWPHLVEGRGEFGEFLRWRFDPDRPFEAHIETSNQLQTDHLVDLHGKLIVDFMGRYENLQADFETVCDRIGIRPPTLPHKRKAKDRKKDYRGYYSDGTAELVAQHFARDIEMLGYRFEGSDDQM
ncbi:MAG: sulfotransferase family protein [Gemmatimonadetes bacterium]|nr:sulfotransferase family protein [Gemmatimonadota bacterium]